MAHEWSEYVFGSTWHCMWLLASLISCFQVPLIALLLPTMSFKDPNTFADPEDSELVRKNKRLIPESIHYSYSEVRNWHRPVCHTTWILLSCSAMWFCITWVLGRQKRNSSGRMKATKTSKRCQPLPFFLAWLLSPSPHLTFCQTSTMCLIFLRYWGWYAERWSIG